MCQNPVKIRRILGLIFIVFLGLLIYASILPVEHVAVPMKTAVDQTVHVPWLNIGLYGRADWVANLLAVLPLGFIGAGAIDHGRKSRRLLLNVLPILIATLCIVVVGIEFLQSWFPIRTQSLNDIVAGIAGGFLGCFLWIIAGQRFVSSLDDLWQRGLAKDTAWIAVALFAMANLIYAMLPLDLIFSLTEFNEKIALGRVQLLPQDIVSTATLKSVLLINLRVFVFACLTYYWKRSSHWIVYSFSFVILCEMVQVPVFSRTASLFNVFASVLGIAAALVAIRTRHSLLLFLRHPSRWIFAGLCGAFALLLSVVIGADRFVEDSSEIRERWRHFVDWPLAKYYYQAEFQALVTMVFKILAFGCVGICFGIGVALSDIHRRGLLRRILFCVAACVATVFEVSQIYFEPHIGDAFDAFVAFLTMCGALFLSESIGSRQLY